MHLKNGVFEASKLVWTKILLLRHYLPLQGKPRLQSWPGRLWNWTCKVLLWMVDRWQGRETELSKVGQDGWREIKVENKKKSECNAGCFCFSDHISQQRAALSGPILRDTARLSQRIPPYCALWGFLGVSTWQIGCDTPSPFSERFPLGGHAKLRVRYHPPPPQKGYLSDTCVIPYENKANGCDTPLCDTISIGYCAIWGGILHWAAKGAASEGSTNPLYVLAWHKYSLVLSNLPDITPRPKNLMVLPQWRCCMCCLKELECNLVRTPNYEKVCCMEMQQRSA